MNLRSLTIPILLAITLILTISMPIPSSAQPVGGNNIDFNIEMEKCDALANENDQIICLKKLMDTAGKEGARIEYALGMINFQRISIVELKPRENFLNARNHFRKALRLDPENEEYQRSVCRVSAILDEPTSPECVDYIRKSESELESEE